MSELISDVLFAHAPYSAFPDLGGIFPEGARPNHGGFRLLSRLKKSGKGGRAPSGIVGGHPMRFEDTEQVNDPDAVCVPRSEDLAAVFAFADETAPGPSLVHCQMGLSRSTAIALVLLVRKLWPAPDALTAATAALLQIRPQSRPNSLIARLGFELFMPRNEARDLAKAVIEHPQFAANRSATSAYSRRATLPYER